MQLYKVLVILLKINSKRKLYTRRVIYANCRWMNANFAIDNLQET